MVVKGFGAIRAKFLHAQESSAVAGLTEADLGIIDRAAKRRGFVRAHFVRDAAPRAAEDTLMEAVPIRLKPLCFAFLEVLSKPAGAVPKLSELLRRKAPWVPDAGK